MVLRLTVGDLEVHPVAMHVPSGRYLEHSSVNAVAFELGSQPC